MFRPKHTTKIDSILADNYVLNPGVEWIYVKVIKKFNDAVTINI